MPAENRGYTYDPAWNLNYRTNNGSLSTFLVDPKNQLTNAFATPDSYDGNGNLTALGTHKVLVYDDENRLIQWFSYRIGFATPTNDDLRCDFVYDGLGRLRKKLEYAMVCPTQSTNPPPQGAAQQAPSSGGGGGNGCTWTLTNEVHYVYDGWRVIQERDGNNTPQVSYTRGNDLSVSLEGAAGIGGLLARSSGYSSGNWTSHADYYADGNGNVTSLSDSNQTVVASYRYDPFGNIISKSGSMADANVYRFSSKEVHVASGIYYYGFRFYEPNLQRWVNQDPFTDFGSLAIFAGVVAPWSQTERSDAQGEDVSSDTGLSEFWTDLNKNVYRVMGNAPTIAIDPYGLASVCTPAGAEALVIAVGEEEAAETIGATAARAAARRIAARAAQAAKSAKQAAETAAKSLKEYQEHVAKMKDALDKLKKAKDALSNASGKARGPIEKEVKVLEQAIKGHLKEISQKWPDGCPGTN